MVDGMNEFKKELSVKWIKAKSGSTYLCPVNALERMDNPSEEQLKLICVEESANPQND
jgi:mannose-6-phosphate isomerase-like protein (cupin superfamily)